ncbi:hypothetical protein O0S10_10405 [Methanocorpusculum sp. MG]|uniref:Uncharacterized protein n=1 Tax=Methanocorpusculum petauri TaxID=3002863 RepID=A0ABT4IJQ3_9EURY|nr:hypothetical protein [Methanocorpusculum petauri]MCZ0861619.1 hypothetical protein [Methanocorpusculum petauri]
MLIRRDDRSIIANVASAGTEPVRGMFRFSLLQNFDLGSDGQQYNPCRCRASVAFFGADADPHNPVY